MPVVVSARAVSARGFSATRSVVATRVHSHPHTAKLVVAPKAASTFHSTPYMWNTNVVPWVVLSNSMRRSHSEESADIDWSAAKSALFPAIHLILLVITLYFVWRTLKTAITRQRSTSPYKDPFVVKYRDVL